MAIKIRRHKGNGECITTEAFIANDTKESIEEAAYIQRYHALLDAAYTAANRWEIGILDNYYDSDCSKERNVATQMAIRILTRVINQ
jgi:hypothetical protein